MTTPINLRRVLIAVLGSALLSTGMLALVFGFAGNPAGAVTQSSLNDGLVAYYPFSGNANDATGNGHDGILEGGAALSSSDAPPPGGSNSLSLDGSDDYVSVPDDPALDFDASTPMTISLWAKKTSDPGGVYHILSKREGCGAMNYQLARDSNGFAFASDPYPETQVTTSVSDLPSNAWIHLAVTYDPTSSTLNIYADGQLVGSDSSYQLGPSHNGPLKIGAADGCGATFPGLLDEVRIYNRALSATDVERLAKPGIDDGMVAYYPFSGNANDATGNGHDGTLQGGANTFPTDVPSSAGAPSSLSFDGSDDAVSVPDDPALDFDASTPMTISLWAKKTSNPGSGIYHILGKREGCDTARMNYQLARDHSGFAFTSSPYPEQQVSTSVEDLTLDKWTHLAVTYDPTSSTLNVYADGELVGSASSYELGATHDDPLMIGASGTCGNTFPGLLDEVRIYNRALSATDIGSLSDTAPKLNLPSDITVKATNSNGAVVSYTAEATDDKDGTITPTCTPASGSNFPIGSTTVNCSAKDAAGNEATGSFTVNVAYDFGESSTGGIFAEPVSQTALNTIKAGRGVPVKFGMGGDFGLDIFASGYPTSKRIQCPDEENNNIDPSETLAISTSGLKYDPTTKQYVYGWKTDRAWAGSCRQLVLKFADGTSQPVNFQFT